MSLVDFFVNNREQHNGSPIGKYEVVEENVPSALVSMLESMGMSNPTGITTTTSKSVKVTKKGNKYTLTLLSYTPPITVQWTGMITTDKLQNLINHAVEKRLGIGYINTLTLNNGVKLFQIAFC